MSYDGISDKLGPPLVDRIKLISGWCIEQRRKRESLTQADLATRVGIGTRWLREIEGGNPKTTIDDHLRCAAGLGLTTGYVLILMMFLERDIDFPRELLLDDLPALEERCIESITAFSVSSLARRLSPTARRAGVTLSSD